MIIRFFPDLPPRPETPANAAYRRAYFSRWGHENYVLCCSARETEYMPYSPVLTIKSAWNGTEHYDIGNRRIGVDDDSYLILNEGQRYSTHIRSSRPVGSLSIFFRPGMPHEAAAGLTQTAEQLLADGPNPSRRRFYFAENLRPHDALITPLLRSIRREIEAGQDDENWVEEQLQRLCAQMIRAEPGYRGRAERLASASRSAHAELLARIDRAADFILSAYTRRITLDDIAAAAQLSKFHLVRLFRRVYGVTPYAFLLRKRISAARRLLAGTDLAVTEVAEQCGFGTRFTLFRQLRAAGGDSSRALRGRAAAGPILWSDATSGSEPSATVARN